MTNTDLGNSLKEENIINEIQVIHMKLKCCLVNLLQNLLSQKSVYIQESQSITLKDGISGR